MKKRLSLLLSSLIIFSLISCNEQKPSSHTQSKTEQPSSERSSLPIIISTMDSSSESSSSSDVASSSTSSENTSSSEQTETYYHVTFVNYDGSPLYETDVLEGSAAQYSGETPTREEDDEFTYEFDGWDKELTNIQSNTTFIAQFKAVAKEGWGPIIWF